MLASCFFSLFLCHSPSWEPLIWMTTDPYIVLEDQPIGSYPAWSFPALAIARPALIDPGVFLTINGKTIWVPAGVVNLEGCDGVDDCEVADGESP